jgi:dihydrofolate reductase
MARPNGQTTRASATEAVRAPPSPTRTHGHCVEGRERSGADPPARRSAGGDAVDVVARIKEESEVPLRSHGSLSMNRALMAAGLVDRVQVTLFPVITGQTGVDPIFQGAADFDLELIESRTLDGNIQELIYRPTLHV